MVVLDIRLTYSSRTTSFDSGEKYIFKLELQYIKNINDNVLMFKPSLLIFLFFQSVRDVTGVSKSTGPMEQQIQFRVGHAWLHFGSL